MGSILAKNCSCVLGRVLGPVRYEKQIQGNWPKVNKDGEGLPVQEIWITSLLRLYTSSSERTPRPFLSACVFLCSFCLKKTNCFLCALSHALCCVSNNKLGSYFLQIGLLEIFLLSNGGKSQGHFTSSLQPLVVWWLGVLVSIQATQVQFLGTELPSLFRTAHCSPSQITLRKCSIVLKMATCEKPGPCSQEGRKANPRCSLRNGDSCLSPPPARLPHSHPGGWIFH